MINLDANNSTIDATTQLVIRFSDNPILYQRFKNNYRILKYNHVTADVFVNTFSAENMSRSKSQFTCAQAFVTDFWYNQILPMKSNVDVHHSMKNLFKNVGVTPAIISDFSGEQVQGGGAKYLWESWLPYPKAWEEDTMGQPCRTICGYIQGVHNEGLKGF